MERHFDTELGELKEQLLLMGARAEAIVQKAVESVRRGDRKLAEDAIADDETIDMMEIDIGERCVNLLALRQPMAVDLRFIAAALKISNDLERVGDHGVNIAGNAIRLAAQTPIGTFTELPRLAGMATAMLHEALDAFVRRDAASARYLVRRDDEVDALNREVFESIVNSMIDKPHAVRYSMEWISVSRNLERIADYATNIAEEVVYIAEARIIKHHFDDREAPPPSPGAAVLPPPPPSTRAASGGA